MPKHMVVISPFFLRINITGTMWLSQNVFLFAFNNICKMHFNAFYG